ncbi:SDR family oxidoreductase [Piscinibacter sakaiensis]|uniref:SDR family oxidoreductase n=1 Tax=Piscinibacter sakaiensis TaxID=1547922 RepID=UPI003AAEC259
MTSGSGPLVLISGASSGIGQALAARFARGGYRLALLARREDALQQWIAAQQFDPSRARAWAADVRDLPSLAEASRRCIAEQGLPDVVIANAGISVGIDTEDAEDLEVFRASLETNLLGVAATFQPFLRGMRERRSGTLVGIASVAGIRGLPGHGAYCSSKAGVISYCESLRGECRGQGIDVVTIVPGYVDTPLTQRNRYSMPFLMAPDKFADKAFAAITAGASYRVIPWQMGVIAKLMRALPNPLFDRLLAGRPRKRRRSE